MKLKVLIVDDDDKFLSILKSILVEEDHDVTTCNNGLDAIKKCGEEKFDLVITDLMMPGAGGMEVLKETKKLFPDTLVVLITGYASLESAIEAIREGAYDYITKPFKLDEIKIVANHASEKIRLVEENQRLFKELQEAYKQLKTIKTIMGADGTAPGDANNSQDANQPVITGSMLPYHYSQNQDGQSGVISDLERISELKENGFLSEEEFLLCKSKLLKL